jgi:hypothetical protein
MILHKFLRITAGAANAQNSLRVIAAKVAKLMALCDQLEAQLTTTQSESSRLLESALHHCLNDSHYARNEMDKQSIVSVG